MVSCAALAADVQQPVGVLPNNAGSLKFLIIGDTGSGDRPQYDVAQAMLTLRPAWRYDSVLMLATTSSGHSGRPITCASSRSPTPHFSTTA